MKTITQPIQMELIQFYWEWGNEPKGHVTVGRYTNDDALKTIGWMSKDLLNHPAGKHIYFNCPYN